MKLNKILFTLFVSLMMLCALPVCTFAEEGGNIETPIVQPRGTTIPVSKSENILMGFHDSSPATYYLQVRISGSYDVVNFGNGYFPTNIDVSVSMGADDGAAPHDYGVSVSNVQKEIIKNGSHISIRVTADINETKGGSVFYSYKFSKTYNF